MLLPQLPQLAVEQYQDQYKGDLGSYHDGHCQEGPLLDSFIGCTNWEEEEEVTSMENELECVTTSVATNLPMRGVTLLKIPVEAYASPIAIDYRKVIIYYECKSLADRTVDSNPPDNLC